MSGSAIKVSTPSSGARTLTLVGRTGNGKSATGNTILGRKAFKSYTSSSGVTGSCEWQQTVRDGRMINVIDTPGLFDMSVGTDFICKEIVKCMDMAKDGIHAFLLVFSVLDRFSEEEAAAFHILKNMFGSKIVNYMIVVFTGGDQLEEDEMTLDDYLGRNCPPPLKEILTHCKNRQILFDNKTGDQHKKSEQVQKLLSFIDMVLLQNGGQPYTNEYFVELKKGAMKLQVKKEEVDSSNVNSKQDVSEMKKQMQREYDELLKQTTDKLEKQFAAANAKLMQQLETEEKVREKAEAAAREKAEAAAQKKAEAAAREKAAREKAEAAAREKAEAAAREKAEREKAEAEKAKAAAQQKSRNEKESGGGCFIL